MVAIEGCREPLARARLRSGDEARGFTMADGRVGAKAVAGGGVGKDVEPAMVMNDGRELPLGGFCDFALGIEEV